MNGYRIEWDKKVERFGVDICDELKEEYDKILGYSKKELCNFFGKKNKNQVRKGNTQRLLKRGKIKDYKHELRQYNQQIIAQYVKRYRTI